MRHHLLPLLEVPAFSRVQILDFGSLEECRSASSAVDNVAAVWTRSERDSNPFATVGVVGLIDNTQGLVWVPDDATVRVVEGPKYAGQPDELARVAPHVEPPAGSQGPMITPEGWPDLLWDNDLVMSPVLGWDDAETSVEVLMCALDVVPARDQRTRDLMLAALKARYAKVVRDPRTYDPVRYPWLNRTSPGKNMLEYLSH